MIDSLVSSLDSSWIQERAHSPLLDVGLTSDQHRHASKKGKQLYKQRCSGWHAGIKDSAKAGRSMNRLCTAILTQPQHRPVSNLTDEQVLLIATALRESEEKQPRPEKGL